MLSLETRGGVPTGGRRRSISLSRDKRAPAGLGGRGDARRTLMTSSSTDRHSTDSSTSTTEPSSSTPTTLTGTETAFPVTMAVFRISVSYTGEKGARVSRQAPQRPQEGSPTPPCTPTPAPHLNRLRPPCAHPVRAHPARAHPARTHPAPTLSAPTLSAPAAHLAQARELFSISGLEAQGASGGLISTAATTFVLASNLERRRQGWRRAGGGAERASTPAPAPRAARDALPARARYTPTPC